jgi:hypothetical protein
MRTAPLHAPFGAGFALLLAAIGAGAGFASGAASREPAHQALRVGLERSSVERGRLEAELSAARADADRTRQALDQARRELLAEQAKAGAPPDAGVRDRPAPEAPALRRPAGPPRVARPPTTDRP